MKSNTMLASGIGLYAIQISNIIIPVITLPWLTLKLGVSQFGEFSLILVIVSYLSLAIDYGFNLSGVRDIAHTDKQERSNIFFNILLIRILIFLLVSLLFLTIATSELSDIASEYKYLIILFSINSVINITWFFQGIDLLFIASTTILITRAISIPLLFIFVQTSQDIDTAILIQFIPSIVSSVILLYLVNYKNLLLRPSVTFKSLQGTFSSGLGFFLTTSLSSAYVYSYILILGLTLGSVYVGAFTVADKVIKAFQALISPLSMLYYKKIASNIAFKEISTKENINRLLINNLTIGLIISLTIFIFSKSIITLFFSENYFKSIEVLRLLSILPLFFGVYQACYIILLSLKKENVINKLYLLVITISLPLVYMILKNNEFLTFIKLIVTVEFFLMISAFILVVFYMRIHNKHER